MDDFPELIDSLNPPATPAAIASVEQELGAPLPPAVRESFLVADGQDLESNGVGLFYGLHLLPLEEVMREWHFWRQAEADPATGANPAVLATMASIPPQWVKSLYACRGWLPLLSDRSGNYVGVDLDPAQSGQWGQTIIFGRDFDRKCVLWRGEGESGWAKWISSIVDELESREGWEVDRSSDDEDEIGYSSYSGANMYGDGGHSMRLTGEYKGWNVLEAWWDKSVRKWEGLGLGMDVAEIERGLDEARRLAEGGSKGKGKESARNSIEVAGIRSNQRTAEVEIPVLNTTGSPELSPAIPQYGEDRQNLLPPTSPEVSAIPRILHPKGTPTRTSATNHPLESPSSSSGKMDFLSPPSHRSSSSSSSRQQNRKSRPPPPAAQLDLPTRADVQAAQAVANAESRGLRGGWVMSLDTSAGAANRRKTHNISPSLDAEMVDIDLEGGRQEAFGTPPMSAVQEEQQAEEDRLSMAPIEHRTRSPVLLGMSRTPSPLAQPARSTPPTSPPDNANRQSTTSASSQRWSSSSSSEAQQPARSSTLVSLPSPPLRAPSPSALPPNLAAAAEAAIRRPDPVVGYRAISPTPDADWHEREVIRGNNDRRRSSTTPTSGPGATTPSRGDSLMSADSDGLLLPLSAEPSPLTGNGAKSPPSSPPATGGANGHSAFTAPDATPTAAGKRKTPVDALGEGLEEVSLG